MGRGFRIGSILGFDIDVDPSWFLIVILLWWSLSAGFFPASLPDRGTLVYAVMGLAATILFFVSLLAHELSHSVVARAKGISIAGITLFVFGGMARTMSEPEDPNDELLIAGVGPVTSFVLGGLLLGAAWLGATAGAGPEVTAVLRYLGVINILLAAFNLLPGFPLDGGRILRAALWKRTDDLERATHLSSRGGRWIGFGLMGLGVLEALAGALLGGLWLVFIGLFLKGAADQSVRQFELKRTLEETLAREVMSPVPPVVHAGVTLADWVHDSLMATRHSTFPVVHGNRLVGLVDLDQIEETPRDEWSETTIADVMTPLEEVVVVGPDAAMREVVTRLRSSGDLPVLVMRNGAPEGLVTPTDIQAHERRARLVRDRSG